MQVVAVRCPRCRHKLLEYYGGKYVVRQITEKEAIIKYSIKSKCPKCKSFVLILQKSN